MDRDTNIWESLGLAGEPPKPAESDERSPSLSNYVDDSEDADIFACLGLKPETLLEKPAPPPKRVRRYSSFEDRWRFEEAYWKARQKYEREWRELSGQTLFFDAPPFPTKEQWMRGISPDPYETDLHSTPHR